MTFNRSKIETTLFSEGASLVGFADISDLPSGVRHSMNCAISIAVALNPAIIGDIVEGPTMEYYHEYNRVNNLLSDLCHRASDILHDFGCDSFVIEPTVKKVDPGSLFTPLPHKTAARRAGHGWIGKSALLITKQYGAAVRTATVLCSTDFTIENRITGSQCGDCTECVTHCPANAITGHEWRQDFHRDMIYDARACYDTAKRKSKEIGVQSTICGICVNVCPWTQRYIKR